jgi:hypothetical protein
MIRTRKDISSVLDLRADRKRALELTPVSDDIVERLDRLVDLLLQWQAKINLVGRSTIPELWTRHIADSLQLVALAPPRGFGSISARVADFPGSLSLVHWQGKRRRRCIWSRARQRRRPIYVRLHGSLVFLPLCMRNELKNLLRILPDARMS